MYDVTEPATFESVQRWVNEVRSLTEPNTVLMLVGNKIDKCESSPEARKVSKSMADEFARNNKMLFIESSAEESKCVKEAFEVLLKTIYDTSKDHKLEPNSSLVKVANTFQSNSSKCC